MNMNRTDKGDNDIMYNHTGGYHTVRGILYSDKGIGHADLEKHANLQTMCV